MVERNIEIKDEQEFSAWINIVKENEGNNDGMSKEEISFPCCKDRYEYEERTDEVTGNKEIKQENTEIVVYEDIAFWPRT